MFSKDDFDYKEILAIENVNRKSNFIRLPVDNRFHSTRTNHTPFVEQKQCS